MEIGTVKLIDIDQEMRGAYLDYAMSVITARALPDVRDGLKPVQRRVLYVMDELNLRHTAPYKKSARIVGECLGKYHPHGDVSVYDTMVRLAQDFSMRYLLVDGQGNFGSVDGDPPAAMRYCVTGDTLVVTDQGLLPIRRLSPGSEDLHRRILSAGSKVNVANKWFDSGEHPTLRVRTRHGYEVTGTHNHPLLTWQAGPDGRPTFVWKTLDTLVPGDWLVLDRTPDTLWPAEPLDLRGYHPLLPPGSRSENHPLPETLDETLAFLLGALTAEGSANGQRIEFNNIPGEFADRFRAAWQIVFPTCRLHEFLKAPSSFGQQSHLQFQVVATQVRLFLEQLGIERVKAAERTVPEVVLRSPKHVVAAFLRAYFEGDGAVEQSGHSLLLVSACSSSRQLLQQVQVLLLRFGIVSWLRPDRPGTYKLSIRNRENVALFAQQIGFVSARKQAALHNVLTRLTGRSLSKADYVPFLALFVRRIAHRHREWLSKHNFDRYPRLATALPRLSEALPPADFAWIGSLNQTHYLFDPVTEITEAGLQRVYSLRVDSPCHSFCANGFINHNTEARLTALAEEMLVDIDKNTVDFVDNFDATLKEPAVLPARVPNLLINGASGIAVGMATNIPPHNLKEVCAAITFLIDKYEKAIAAGFPYAVVAARTQNRPVDRQALLTARKPLADRLIRLLTARNTDAGGTTPTGKKTVRAVKVTEDQEADALLSILDEYLEVTVDDLNRFILGPDFPTGGIIFGQEGIKQAYATGRGRITLRAKAHIEEVKGDRFHIVITEIPYQVNKAALVERIADLVKDGRVQGISDLRDESDRQGMRIVIELKKETQPQQVLNQLFKLTPLQSTFSVNLLALVDGEPRVLTLKRLLQHYIEYRHQVITRRTQYDLDKAKLRAHILQGLKIALDNLDAVIQTIRESRDADIARTNLMRRFKLTEIQATAILDMQLRRLAALERKKIEDELKETLKLIAYLEDLLAHPAKIYGLIRADLTDLAERFGDDRRTKIKEEEAAEFSPEDLIPDEDMVVAVTARSYIKRYRPPRRGRAGIVSETDPERQVVVANMHDTLLFVTDTGRVAGVKCHEIPENDRAARGIPLSNLITLDSKESIAAIVPVPRGLSPETSYLAIATSSGKVKRTALSEFILTRGGGVIGVGLGEGESVAGAVLTMGNGELLLATRRGQVIRFQEEEVRSMGRAAGGVAGIRLEGGDDALVSLALVKPEADLLGVTTTGLAKRSSLSEFPTQGRGGGGVVFVKPGGKNGYLAGVQVVTPADDVTITTSAGKVWRGPAEAILRKGRSLQPEALELKPAAKESVVAVCAYPAGNGGDKSGWSTTPEGRARPAAGKSAVAKAGGKTKAGKAETKKPARSAHTTATKPTPAKGKPT